MSLRIKKTLNFIDLFFGYLMSALIHISLYVLSFFICVLGVWDIFTTPFFDESKDDVFRFDSYSTMEVDSLEILAMLLFVFVTVRFFKLGKAEGLTRWLCLKSYVFVSAVSLIVPFTVSLYFILIKIFEYGMLYETVVEEDADLLYFGSAIFYILALYAFTALPKLSRLQKIQNQIKARVNTTKDAEGHDFSAPKQEVFFTDSIGNTEANSANTNTFYSAETDNK